MDRGKLLSILSWVLLKQVLLAVALVVYIAIWDAVPHEFREYTPFLVLMIPIGDWVRQRIVPKYCEDQFANMSPRFKTAWSLIWWGIFVGLGVIIVSGALRTASG